MISSKPGDSVVVRRRTVLKEKHEVDVFTASLFDLTRGIDPSGVGIDHDLEKSSRRIVRSSEALEGISQTGKIETADDSIDKSDGIIFGDHNFNI